jgi:CRP/FNR family transcriptional regulator
MDMSIPPALHVRVNCSNCALRRLCLPPGLSHREIECAEDLVSTRLRIRRGASLYRSGDAFKSLYAVRLGSLKSLTSTADAREQVTGFHMTGDMIGFDGLGAGSHTCGVVALEDAEVCVFPYQRLEEVTSTVPALRQHLHRLMSRDIVRQQHLMLMLGGMHAHERLAGFLVDLADRFEERGYSSREFILRMTRAEIGSFLGLTLETVSRVMSQFSRDGLIDLRNVKQIRLADPAKLRRIAAGGEAARAESLGRMHEARVRMPRPTQAVAAPRTEPVEELAC